MTGRDIVDEIDALIDAQLDAGEPIGGYDYDDPDFPTCGHCGGSWHGLAITERMVQMRWRGEMDPDYRYRDDDSRIVCPGSEFIGPVPAPQPIDGCDCWPCQRLRQQRAVREGGFASRHDYSPGGIIPNTMYPPEMRWPRPYNPDPFAPPPWTGPACWWRFDITAHLHLDEIEVQFETEGLTVVRSIVGLPARHALSMRVVDGDRTISGLTALTRDAATGNVAHQTGDENGQPLTLDVHAARPHDLGGTIVWHEIDGPGGNYVRSRAVIPTTRIDQWFYDRGLSFLAPREMRTAVDRLLDAVGVAPWQRELVNRWVNGIRRRESSIGIRDGAPYFVGEDLGSLGYSVLGTLRPGTDPFTIRDVR
ncbi:DNA binding protein [Gordonia phage William]|uniref:Uncharacterized protein n=1 Tax=Gordonia phage William TaxID=2571253 RepID=A0A4Y6EIK1_9CAUD|nr:DNA binding protein [Gordonia phage William]QDF17171.1 hypothetical protein SEA_WILLIAM_76 [Gordonia phage William]